MPTVGTHLSFTSLTRGIARCCLIGIATTSTLAACSDSKSADDKLAEVLIDQAATAPTDQAGPAPDQSTGSADTSVPADASPPDVTTPTAASTGTPVEKVQIDKTVWWGGFKITVGTAEGSSNALGQTINIEVGLENLTADVARLDRKNVVLTVGGQSYLAGLGQTPEVPPAGRNDVVLDFLIDETFVADQAVLTFGQPDVNQAVVPFGAEAATSFEPRVLTTEASLVTSTETIQLTGCTIEASYAPQEKGTFIVRLPLEVTYTGGAAGGDLILPTQFALRSPDGSSVVGVAIAPGDIVAEGVYTGQPLTGKVIAFKVDAVDTGTWTISYTDSTGKAVSAEFTVPT